MTREQARQEINSRITELPKAKKRVSGHDSFICPFCGNGGGTDGTGISTKDGKGYKCFSCDFNGNGSNDYLGILKLLHSETEQDIFTRYNLTIDSDTSRPSAPTAPKIKQETQQETETETPPTDYTAYFLQAAKALQESPTGQEYLQGRGISLETAARYKLGFVSDWKHPKVPAAVPPTARVIIPTGRHTYTARDTNPNATEYVKQKVKGGEGIDGSPLFNIKAISSTESLYIFVVEGEFDALSVIEAGGQAVAIGGTANKNKFIQAVKETPPAVPLVLSLDVDANEAGQMAQADIKKELEALKIPFYEVNISGEYNDPNEHLQNNRTTFMAYIKNPIATAREQRRAAYMDKNAVLNCLNAFMDGIKESVNTPATPTGFTMLDEVLDGGFYEGLYILGAISSIGKTSFCLQIADQIAKKDDKVAKKGQDVIIFSLEMSKYELISKSLSRLTMIADKGKNDRGFFYARTNRQITDGAKWAVYGKRETDLINKAVDTYRNEYAPNIYIYEGIGDIGAETIKNIVREHISFTGNKPLVLIDYLQILQPYEMRATDKQNTDKSVLELKRMTREYKIPVLAISSFNRDNYLSPVNMASFKESGAIEYSSDVLFGLQFDGMDNLSEYEGTDERRKNASKADMLRKIEGWKTAEPRKVQLKILKNRNGATGENIYYNYYPKFNLFTENMR
jgi:replicative DNA helicase